MLQPQNAVAISSWFDDPSDTQLFTLLPWFVNAAQDEVRSNCLTQLPSNVPCEPLACLAAQQLMLVVRESSVKATVRPVAAPPPLPPPHHTLKFSARKGASS